MNTLYFLVAMTIGTPISEIPVAVIVGADVAQPGEIVQLKTTGSVGGRMFVWQSFPSNVNHFFLPVLLPIGVNPDGSFQFEHAAIFSSLKKGRYAIILAVAKNDQVALAVHDIQVGDNPNPDPDPDPDPPDPPDPNPDPEPDPDSEVGVFVKELVESAVVGNTKVQESRALAENFRLVASRIEDARDPMKDGIVTREAAIEAVYSLNKDSLPGRYEAWEEVRVKLNEYLRRHEESGKLKTIFQVGECFNQIAEGLEAVR